MINFDENESIDIPFVPQVKRTVIISNKHSICELLPIDLKLRKLGKIGKISNFIEL